jgi:hypothetical protein
MKVANTLPALFDLAVEHGEARTRQGGWSLQISVSGSFQLMRYHHCMLQGILKPQLLTHIYTPMLKTDAAGCKKFLDRFDFPARPRN